MPLPTTPDELLSTTRAVRKRLDFDRPVPKELVMECIDLAFQAPTGSNRQGWSFVVIDDAAKKQAIADLYARSYDAAYANAVMPDYRAGDSRGERQGKVKDSATHLRDNFQRVPYMVIPCILGRVGASESSSGASFFGSILPAFWSFMLAARARGLGTAWTSLHLRYEQEVADIVGIPFDKITQCGLTPLAYTIGTDFKPAQRLDTEKLVHWNSW